jgi:pimeloyl-ACP methyl ester carboxylesterase
MTLVFLHYFGGSARSWSALTPLLDVPCVTLDLPGFGDAPFVADAVVAVLERLEGIDDYLLVGHSMGGKVALSVASTQPPGLRGLVLVAPSPPSPEPMPEAERARLLAAFGVPDALEETLRKTTFVELPESMRQLLLHDNMRSSRAGWNAWLQSGSRVDESYLMPLVTLPTLVVAGEHDQGMTAELLEREVVGRVKGARLVTVPGAGHLIPMEAPAALAAMLREELASGFISEADR